MYNLIIRTAGEVLKEYGEKYLGGKIGFTAVLHTWGQTMQAHPHVHIIATGGAMVETDEGEKWVSAKETFLFPVKKLSKDFRDKFCEGIAD